MYKKKQTKNLKICYGEVIFYTCRCHFSYSFVLTPRNTIGTQKPRRLDFVQRRLHALLDNHKETLGRSLREQPNPRYLSRHWQGQSVQQCVIDVILEPDCRIHLTNCCPLACRALKYNRHGGPTEDVTNVRSREARLRTWRSQDGV